MYKVLVWECEHCYAVIPYKGCQHNCLNSEEEEGFCEEEDFMSGFGTWLQGMLSDTSIEVYIVAGINLIPVA